MASEGKRRLNYQKEFFTLRPIQKEYQQPAKKGGAVEKQAVKVSFRGRGLQFASCDFGQDELRAAAKAERADVPTMILVETGDLRALRELRELVDDQGAQHRSRALFSYFGKPNQKIPLLAGKYMKVGRLVGAISRFFVRSHENKDEDKKRPTVLILGVKKNVLVKLRDAAKINLGRILSRSADVPALTCLYEELAGDNADEWTNDRRMSDLAKVYLGDSIVVSKLRQMTLRAADCDDTVLIVGETGTGKEVIARAIHNLGTRKNEPFVAVNCPAISPYILEVELFGQEADVVAGARASEGALLKARGGTVFLDEIGDLLEDHQAKLLRVFGDGGKKYVRHVGGSQEYEVKARIIAATNRDLHALIYEQRFRDDLYYRLNQFYIRTPPLREHPQDIPILAQHLWRSICGDEDAQLSNEILKELQLYPWIANVRELRSVLAHMRQSFHQSSPGLAHLRMAFHSYHAPVEAPKLTRRHAEAMQWQATVQHLSRLDEVLRACRVDLKPLSEKTPAARSADRIPKSRRRRRGRSQTARRSLRLVC
jgi:DNA-binding NtrC family response regulator